MTDQLGDRMKANYEDASRAYLPRRMPMIIRVDGRAFHTLTANMKRPWDDAMIETMLYVAKYLCENVQNTKLAYVQSDEISLLLTDYDRLTTEAWFDRNIQKMTSISAALATLAFNKKIKDYYPEKEGVFDSRVFVLPREEVCNYYLWRQNDATRNSVQMLARSVFSHKSLDGLNNAEVQDRLVLEKGINWNDTSTHKKRGACVRKIGEEWKIDLDPPIFSKERAYINDLLIAKEE
jgi:tRNA(His) 5'-end guanylyltransferase